jgi:hypothetical protein
MEKRKEIRILNPDPKLLKQLKQIAKDNKRTVGKQAEYILEWYVINVKK